MHEQLKLYLSISPKAIMDVSEHLKPRLEKHKTQRYRESTAANWPDPIVERVIISGMKIFDRSLSIMEQSMVIKNMQKSWRYQI